MRSKKGLVTSNKQDKTIVISVHSYKTHPKYKKRYRVTNKFHAHNPENTKFEIGDEVTVYETRPLSKLKRWTTERPSGSSSEPKGEPSTSEASTKSK